MINPEYIEKKGKLKSGKEGCLSRPETILKPVSVKRYYKIKIKYTDVNGTERIAKYKNYFARVIQHEIDHLDGISIQ
jgi:peptide deformylase